MNWQLDVLRGRSVLQAVKSPELVAAWSEAAAADPKSTWFQEPTFVRAWFAAYHRSFEPILALARRNADNRVVGLLAAGLSSGGDRLVHAGANHAWYHGWIAAPEVEGDFPAAATTEILRTTGVRTWRWNYLPPRAPADWAEGAAGGAIIGEERSPIWELNTQDAIDRHLQSRSLRNYINRYRRRGELALRRAATTTEAHRWLDLLAPWCDLRHGAVHADLPFRDDPYKLPFHQELIARGAAGMQSDPSVLTSALLLDHRVLAVHLGAFDGTRLYLGLHGYNPTEGKQSPGTILLIELAQQVAALGGTEIDMTPGGEPWKERWATRSEPVARVELHATAARRAVARAHRGLREQAKHVLSSVGVAPKRRIAAGGLEEPDSKSRPRSPERHALFEIEIENTIAQQPSPEPLPTAILEGERAREHHATRQPETVANNPSDENAPRADWLSSLIDFATTRPRGEMSSLLGNALTRLDKGWLPLCSTNRSGLLATMAWLQPAEMSAQLNPDVGLAEAAPSIADPSSIRLTRGPIAKKKAFAGGAAPWIEVPSEVAMLLIARQSGSAAEGSRTDREDQEDQVRDPDPARLLLAAAERSGRSRLWIVADRDTRLGEWLDNHGARIDLAELVNHHVEAA